MDSKLLTHFGALGLAPIKRLCTRDLYSYSKSSNQDSGIHDKTT